jgi:hypothetical protein
MLLAVDNAIRRRIDMMKKKLTILAAMMLVMMLVLASPAVVDKDRHNDRFDDNDRSHGNVVNNVDDDDLDWRYRGGYEGCWEWSSVFEEWQWDCD